MDYLYLQAALSIRGRSRIQLNKIQLVFILQIFWMKPSDCRRTSHFTRAWESALISNCFSKRGFGLRTPGFWRFSLVAPKSSACPVWLLPVLCLPALSSPKGHCAHGEQSSISCFGFWCSTWWHWWQWRFSLLSDLLEILFPVIVCNCVNVRLLKG